MSSPHGGEGVDSEYPCGNERFLCAPADPHPVYDVDLGDYEHEACAATDLQVEAGRTRVGCTTAQMGRDDMSPRYHFVGLQVLQPQ